MWNDKKRRPSLIGREIGQSSKSQVIKKEISLQIHDNSYSSWPILMQDAVKGHLSVFQLL